MQVCVCVSSMANINCNLFIKLINNVLFYVCICLYNSTCCILLGLWTPWKNRIILLMSLRWAIHPFDQFWYILQFIFQCIYILLCMFFNDWMENKQTNKQHTPVEFPGTLDVSPYLWRKARKFISTEWCHFQWAIIYTHTSRTCIDFLLKSKSIQ